ncbi:unnamed protein product [Pieris macdunnoughi]|uniref:Uncharacterized protein n=1 Tax=Pieris macdunnoughi TaxID=345717 RepID=A0A821U7M7_9NEOP|nr:unnamed protein product [Pieris macdunnoughi]
MRPKEDPFLLAHPCTPSSTSRGELADLSGHIIHGHSGPRFQRQITSRDANTSALLLHPASEIAGGALGFQWVCTVKSPTRVQSITRQSF